MTLGRRVDGAGAVLFAGAGPSGLERCAVDVAKHQRLPAGGDRLYALTLNFVDPELPRLQASIESPLQLPKGLPDRVMAVAPAARGCPPSRGGRLGNLLSWRGRSRAAAGQPTRSAP